MCIVYRGSTAALLDRLQLVHCKCPAIIIIIVIIIKIPVKADRNDETIQRRVAKA